MGEGGATGFMRRIVTYLFVKLQVDQERTLTKTVFTL